ncbi:lipid IV(A) 4-amino-4-deoxy-L-arabinosyltransferase [Candidatus Pantoea soli]|uniref:Undecaprenyl phosphate-alpha-4-amino-4-deoxy-L-arabinose arabinosyl transferase n=1 Tax=Candidatus Pantoea soli TaxID=3098669 RepID=A0A518XJM8_9GAMM|nr:lipid IV(A) 4-amino-4-deoxy-L-arabinosyltransferase [Pantoea soli]QDY44392.1 lipid IV(A) 4-amino-4-deoxy-L-arabinosyltransferase [Pantoea soli]
MSAMKNSCLLIGLLALYYLLPLEFRGLWQPDETRYAEISREMIEHGSWISPHFFDLRYFEKPVGGYWINNIGQLLFGHSNFAVRFGSVFSTMLSALMLYWLSARIGMTRNAAIAAVIIYLTSLLVYGIGTYAVLDPMLTLWMTAAMSSYWFATEAQGRRQSICRYALFGFFCGLGFMTKGFLALAVPALVIFPWMVKQKRFTQVLIYGPVAVISAGLTCAPWAIAIHHEQPDFWNYFFWVEHIQRFAEDNAQHKAPFWYYLPVLLAGSLPWLALLPGAIKKGCQSSANTYLLSWAVIPLIFFSIAKGKLPTYILPCFAPLAMLMAQYGVELARTKSRTLQINAWINIGFGSVAVLAVFFFLAPWGIAHKPVYAPQEINKVVMAAVIFMGWALAGLFSLNGNWLRAALCPLVLALGLGYAIPDGISNTKQPGRFIDHIASNLGESRYIATNSTGVGSAIAWRMERSDIYFYHQEGELKYGLSYPDDSRRFISEVLMADWVKQHRKKGNISVVLMLGRDESIPTSLPPAETTYHEGRMLYLFYGALP